MHRRFPLFPISGKAARSVLGGATRRRTKMESGCAAKVASPR